MSKSLPKALIAYIEEMGVHALDHLAERHHTSREEKGAPAAVVALLVEQWQSLSADDKQRFVERVVTSVADVIASSSRLPAGLRIGAKAVKSAAKVMKKQRKALKKEAKALREESSPKSRSKEERGELEIALSNLVKVRDEEPEPKRARAASAKKGKSGGAKGAAGDGVKRKSAAAAARPSTKRASKKAKAAKSKDE